MKYNFNNLHKTDMERIQELLHEIVELTVGSSFEIYTEDVLSILEMDRADYYRLAYACRTKHGHPISIRDSYNQENIGELMTILESYGYRYAPDLFYKAGYYFNEEKLLNWMEFFLSVSLSRLHSHIIDLELLETSIAGCMRAKDALEFYVLSVFPKEELIQFASALYMKRSEVEDHYLSRHILSHYIHQQYLHNLIREETLYAGLYHRLFDKAVEKGLLDETEEDTDTDIVITEDMRQALKKLELRVTRIPTKEELKKQYRRLLKENHPDLNPQGGERTREITTSYTYLINTLYEGSRDS